MSKYDCDLNLNDRNSLSVLISRIVPESVILEFGPANGRMTKYLREQLSCKVYAVEIDAGAANDTAQYTEDIIVDSIENYLWLEKYGDLKFDFIIFADVLEHLYWPEIALKKSKTLLAKNGSILISIPNIAHNAIIINLLKNEFNYHPIGLLDDTHIRFFTKKTFDHLISDCDLYKAYETAIFMNPENTEFFNSYNDLPTDVANYLKALPFGEAYQFVFELKKEQNTQLTSDFSETYKEYGRYFFQLFLDLGYGISEENSIKLPVLQNTEVQEFIFDLSDKPAFTNIRLDPLNDACVIEIEELKLITDRGERDLRDSLMSNAMFHHGNSYFFDFNDPQIHVDGSIADDLAGAKKLIVRIRYTHTALDALSLCIQQAQIELEQTQTELEQFQSSLSWQITKPLRKIKQILKGI